MVVTAAAASAAAVTTAALALRLAALALLRPLAGRVTVGVRRVSTPVRVAGGRRPRPATTAAAPAAPLRVPRDVPQREVGGLAFGHLPFDLGQRGANELVAMHRLFVRRFVAAGGIGVGRRDRLGLARRRRGRGSHAWHRRRRR